MIQKIIQVGNSYAVTIPKGFAQEMNWKAGDIIHVAEDREEKELVIKAQSVLQKKTGVTPEFKQWLDSFNARYKDALTELAKK